MDKYRIILKICYGLPTYPQIDIIKSKYYNDYESCIKYGKNECDIYNNQFYILWQIYYIQINNENWTKLNPRSRNCNCIIS